MDSRIALAVNTQLHFQNKEGGAVRYTIIKEISTGFTPLIRIACPMDVGLICSNFCFASLAKFLTLP